MKNLQKGGIYMLSVKAEGARILDESTYILCKDRTIKVRCVAVGDLNKVKIKASILKFVEKI